MDATAWISLSVNALAILTGLGIIADRFRRWIEKKVAEPVGRIETKVDDHDARITELKERVEKAHERIDMILGGNNA